MLFLWRVREPLKDNIKYKVGVIGAGAWGTALANIISKKEKVILWAKEKSVCDNINKISENPLDEARVLAKNFSNMAPLSIKETKSNINYSIGRNFEESLAKETSSQTIQGSSEDYMEGVKAFFEKRPPIFKGK